MAIADLRIELSNFELRIPNICHLTSDFCLSVAHIQIFETPELLARAAAQVFLTLAQAAASKERQLNVSLSGGTTPQRVYELLASDQFSKQINWQLVQLFFGDERPVAPNNPASNFGMVRSAFISHVPIPDSHVHPISGFGDPHENARDYERELKSHFNDAPWPQFDLVFLGMGDDGHTASLFPGSAALKEKRAWVVANWIERLHEFRITLTVPAINSAANIVFLVTGESKAKRLAEVLQGPVQPEELPAQRIKPEHGSLRWMVDADAAKFVS